MRAARVLRARVVVTGVVLLAAGAGGGGRLVGQAPEPVRATARLTPAVGALRSGVPAAPEVPAGAADASTSWLATSDAHLRVLFSYHREELDCPGRCEQYGWWLRFQEPSGGAAAPSRDWRQLTQAECADFWADGAQDVACLRSEEMAGRDRRGNDYVLLQLYASRAQLERMLASRTLVFQLGGVGFHLTGAGRDSLRGFLTMAGHAAAR